MGMFLGLRFKPGAIEWDYSRIVYLHGEEPERLFEGNKPSRAEGTSHDEVICRVIEILKHCLAENNNNKKGASVVRNKKSMIPPERLSEEVDCVMFSRNVHGYPYCTGLDKVYCLLEDSPCSFRRKHGMRLVDLSELERERAFDAVLMRNKRWV
jgi:hypothetical protein